MATKKPKRKPKSSPHLTAIPSVADNFHSHLYSSIKITLNKRIYYSHVCAASNTRLTDEYAL